ncbi:MAG: hypothetical protein ACKVVP_03525 [Chloroflexota bacterium]
MGRLALHVIVVLGLSFSASPSAWAAFPEDTPPTFANGSSDPETTADPSVVAAAQRALEAFFDFTNRSYGPAGFANAWLMREEVGNRQDNWLDRVMPLACGRLVTGWKAMNWIPNTGWRHQAPPATQASWTAVDCEFSPPSFVNGGVNPDSTQDPPAVRAAQASLIEFYRATNRDYSRSGYSSAWVMREDVGNSQSAWLDMTLPLARGQLQGGWRNMNWIPGKGWQHAAMPGSSGLGPLLVPVPTQSSPVVTWTPDHKSAPSLAPELERIPRIPTAPQDDGVISRIAESSGLPQWSDTVLPR